MKVKSIYIGIINRCTVQIYECDNNHWFIINNPYATALSHITSEEAATAIKEAKDWFNKDPKSIENKAH